MLTGKVKLILKKIALKTKLIILKENLCVAF